MRAKKSLGQNFLRCDWVAPMMIEAAGVSAGDTILEIGPGTGALTRPLAARAERVIAIEKDEALARGLRSALKKEGIDNVEIIEGDILTIPTSRLQEKAFTIVSNIPYYLTSRLVRRFLESSPRPIEMVLTVQKEVAERMCAEKGDMNLLALSVQVYGTPEKIKDVPRDCFSPPPDVTSAIIRISDISDSFFKDYAIDESDFFSVARAAFSKKRKMLSSSLKGVVPPEAFMRAHINKNARPQELGKEDWARLVSLL